MLSFDGLHKNTLQAQLKVTDNMRKVIKEQQRVILAAMIAWCVCFYQQHQPRKKKKNPHDRVIGLFGDSNLT